MVNFGADSLNTFFKRNNLSMMIRSHSVCPEGIERFSDNLMSITSCTNHSGIHDNDASILVIQKKLIISPKIIKTQVNQNTTVHWQEISNTNIPASVTASIRRDHTPPRKRQNVL
mmetsp:Transcript_13108/g.22124  ORF Transcript_13108/g.22124 Transcript_13108/m.22124 type:complete len:115 (-) Transcript_13108:43-387(-)